MQSLVSKTASLAPIMKTRKIPLGKIKKDKADSGPVAASPIVTQRHKVDNLSKSAFDSPFGMFCLIDTRLIHFSTR
jgi:hypothetical protein